MKNLCLAFKVPGRKFLRRIGNLVHYTKTPAPQGKFILSGPGGLIFGSLSLSNL
jgi:hypothetical protein